MSTLLQRIPVLFLTLIGAIPSLSAAAEAVEVASPNGRLVAYVRLTDGPAARLMYRVTFDGKDVIEDSVLGLEMTNADWSKGVVFDGVAISRQASSWRPVYGERSEIADRHTEAVVSLKLPRRPRSKLELVLRSYDEGIAFRYRFPEHPEGGETLHVTREHTQFVLPAGSRGWFAPAAQAAHSLRPVAEFPGRCERPLTIELPNGLYTCLAEAEMVNFARMQFVRDPGNPTALRCELDGGVDELTPFATPWRVVMVAEKPGQLLENNHLLLTLNPPNAIADPDWIRPGKVIREVVLSTASALTLIDFAAAHRIEFIEFDAGWYGLEYSVSSDATRVDVDPRRNPRNDLDLPRVIAHAAAKGVGVWLYVNQRALAAQLDVILPLYEKWGVKGVKFGFVHVGSHRWTTWLHEAVKKAAAHHLMVDIHDEYRPTGFSRTYPNLLTQEGIRGNEEFPDATHNTVLPFTRFVAGAADYTICYYRQDFSGTATAEAKRRLLRTTSAHQLSLAVVYYSPLQFVLWYDRPSDYQGEPEIEFFERVPTVWDETRVLHGEIARSVSIARRKGDEWFVGTLTNNDAREIPIVLSFLPPGRRYEASLYEDDPTAPTRTKVRVTRVTVDASTVLAAKLRPSGGQAIWLRPIAP